MKKRIALTLRIPVELLEVIDQARGLIPRNAYITRILTEAMDR